MNGVYRNLVANPQKPPPPVRALPPSVVDDLYEIFRPDSPRNPFKTEVLRWRNLLIFMLLLRLGLRRGESALLLANSVKEDFDPVAGKMVHWLNVDETDDGDPRYERPGLKTAASRRQLPLPQEIVDLALHYIRNYRGRVSGELSLVADLAESQALGTPLVRENVRNRN